MLNQAYTFYRVDRRFIKIIFSDILYLESCDHHTKIKTKDKTVMVLAYLSAVEAGLPPDMFCRVHRSYMVAIEHITSFDTEEVHIGDICLPISNPYRGLLEAILPVSNYDKLPGSKVVRLGNKQAEKRKTVIRLA